MNQLDKEGSSGGAAGTLFDAPAIAQDRQETYDLSLLEVSRRKWATSPGLRLVYSDLFSELAKFAVAGERLEVGSGIGAMKETLPDLVTSDLVRTRFVDTAISCYDIGADPRRWGNIFGVDVLHHLRFPLRFFASASEALLPGGRIILNEPAGTAGGRAFYRCFHHEPCRPRELNPPFELMADTESGEFANMGMGVALFVRHREWLTDELEKCGLHPFRLHFRDLLAYPASGGFSKPQILPTSWLKAILAGEKMLPQYLMRRMALRMTIVLEKKR